MSEIFNLPNFLVFFSSGFFVFITVIVCVIISLENRNPSKTISWLLVLTLLPGIGFIFYLFFGENLRKKKWNRTHRAVEEFLHSPEVQESFNVQNLDDEFAKAISMESQYFDIADRNIMQLVLNSGTAPITVHNKVDIFTEGETKFEQMIKDIEQAKDHIHLEYYIIKDSVIGNKIREILIKKAQEGIKVRIMYDDFGSWRLYFKPSYMRSLRKAGCEVYSYLQSRFPFLHRNLNYRNHRKICVIDGKIGYVGGINIGDEYVHQDKKFGFWRDTHLRIEGPAVYMLQLVFIVDWLIRTDKKLIDMRYFPEMEEIKGESVIQIATSGADSLQETIYQAYFYAIAQAKESIYIQTPYFIPDEALMTALKTAILAGVDVRIMFPASPDHFTVYNASLSYLEEIMALGAKVHLYEKGFIHSKVVLVDREVASVGTANMDIRSFMINSEINAFIYDDATVDRLYEMFYKDIEDCRPLSYDEFKNKSLIQRIKESICRLFSPLL